MRNGAVALLLVAVLVWHTAASQPKSYTFWRSGVATVGNMNQIADKVDPDQLFNPSLSSVETLAAQVLGSPLLIVFYSLEGELITTDTQVANVRYNDTPPILVLMNLLLQLDNLAVYQPGESFTWQPIPGRNTTIDVEGRPVTITTLSTSPKVFHIKGLVEPVECERFLSHVRFSSRLVAPSLPESSILYTNDMPYDFWHDESLTLLKRAVNVTRTNKMLEPSIVRLAPVSIWGSAFRLAYDHLVGFPSKRNILGTLMLFLNDVDGGHVVFPRPAREISASELNDPAALRSLCDVNSNADFLRVPAKQGEAILYYNLLDDDQLASKLDNNSLHAHCDHVNGNGQFVIKFQFSNLGVTIMEPGRRVYVFANYTPTVDSPYYLTIKEEDQIFLTEDRHPDWWEGVLHGKRGFFPRSHVERMAYVPKNSKMVKAKPTPASETEATQTPAEKGTPKVTTQKDEL